MTAPRSKAWLRTVAILWIGLLAGFGAGAEWIRTRPVTPTPSGGIDLVGAGATLPYPLYRRWFAEFGASSGARINYFAIGSGEGIRLVLEGEVDFGATDRALRMDERTRATCGLLEIPTVLGAVAVAYHVPGLNAPLRLDAASLAEIFLGRIRRWDAAPIQARNPGVALPPLSILVVHRTTASGTSEVFGDYLRTVGAWRSAQRDDEAVWPVGERIDGNEGVAAHIRVTPGAIGFVGLAYATQGRLAIAALGNAAGAFVLPDSASIARTAEELLTADAIDARGGLVGARDPAAYPVVAITRLVADRVLGDEGRAAHLLAFLRWATTDGAKSATALGFVMPPAPVAALVARRLDALTPGRCALTTSS